LLDVDRTTRHGLRAQGKKAILSGTRQKTPDSTEQGGLIAENRDVLPEYAHAHAHTMNVGRHRVTTLHVGIIVVTACSLYYGLPS
jgi:hypothetical protein